MIRACNPRHALFVEAVILAAPEADGVAIARKGCLGAKFYGGYADLVRLGVELGVYIAEAGAGVEEEMRASMAAAGPCSTWNEGSPAMIVGVRTIIVWPAVLVEGSES